MYSGSSASHRLYGSRESQGYTSVETLLHYLGNNWEADETVIVDWFAQAVGQYCKVYFFLLRRDLKITQIAVLENVRLPHIIADYHLTTVAPMGEPEAFEIGAGQGSSAPIGRNRAS